MTETQAQEAILHFEGLVLRTAAQVVAGGVEIEFEDAAQILRLTVWRSVTAFDHARAAGYSRRGGHGRSRLERYVFGNLMNARKDMEKRLRRHNASIEEYRAEGPDCWTTRLDRPSAPDRFDARYLSASAEEVYAEVERDELALPSTLSDIERRLVTLSMEGWTPAEIELRLGLPRAHRQQLMRSVRDKLADWKPAEPIAA